MTYLNQSVVTAFQPRKHAAMSAAPSPHAGPASSVTSPQTMSTVNPKANMLLSFTGGI